MLTNGDLLAREQTKDYGLTEEEKSSILKNEVEVREKSLLIKYAKFKDTHLYKFAVNSLIPMKNFVSVFKQRGIDLKVESDQTVINKSNYESIQKMI